MRAAARQVTETGRTPDKQYHLAKSTMLNNIKSIGSTTGLLEGVGRYSRALDKALPGKHTRELYDSLKSREARILAQLRTGMAQLNGYLHTIGTADTDICDCSQARETIKHFLFRCTRWDAHRAELMRQANNKGGNLSFHLGGKAPTDPDNWKPDLNIVLTTIKYAVSTGRLNNEIRPIPSSQSTRYSL